MVSMGVDPNKAEREVILSGLRKLGWWEFNIDARDAGIHGHLSNGS